MVNRCIVVEVLWQGKAGDSMQKNESLKGESFKKPENRITPKLLRLVRCLLGDTPFVKEGTTVMTPSIEGINDDKRSSLVLPDVLLTQSYCVMEGQLAHQFSAD
ncbi:hypothetical protein DICVIV_00300 [Dictyocaulus viviparus]|uniref:Uncharacterized protein n=1 Tax=Dictyocaulus viviparus TaxID=29172 RepID=A0A0D8Y9X6_DICVI|nr:hypothetical protein DICVIV_00300 [Dictyocaulus viviparus]